MKNKKLSVTIGIPAHNEEKNIKNLILSVFAQEETFFQIKSIIVVSDASTDSTIEQIIKLRNRRLKVIENPFRKGQVHIQNFLFTYARTDVLVIFEADILPYGKKYLHHLLMPILSNQSVGLVAGSWFPLLPKKLLARAIFYQVQIYQSMAQDYPASKHWLISGRGGRAFTKSVYRRLRWPYHTPEDIYAVLWCIENKVKSVFEKNAVCNYRVPETFGDFFCERQKIRSGFIVLKKYFSSELLNFYYTRPMSFGIRSFICYFTSHPIYCLIYIFLKIRVGISLSSTNFTDFWPITLSTKLLSRHDK